jgi:hypothetical protein
VKLDWKNIDWGALAGSKVLIGNAVTLIAGIAAITGHALPNSMQSQLTDLLTQAATLVATAGAFYSAYHRTVAQAEDATTIVPRKDQSTTNPTKGE